MCLFSIQTQKKNVSIRKNHLKTIINPSTQTQLSTSILFIPQYRNRHFACILLVDIEV